MASVRTDKVNRPSHEFNTLTLYGLLSTNAVEIVEMACIVPLNWLNCVCQ
jgi:hypothetical protein